MAIVSGINIDIVANGVPLVNGVYAEAVIALTATWPIDELATFPNVSVATVPADAKSPALTALDKPEIADAPVAIAVSAPETNPLNEAPKAS